MKFQRNSIWPALVALMLPQPLLAIESGVNAVYTVEEIERLNIAEWAYMELKDLFQHGREKLEPLLPRVESSFNLFDAEVAQFIAEGVQEQARLEQMIEAVGQEQPEPEPVVQETMIAQPEPIVIDGVTYVPVITDKPLLEIGMTEEGRLLLDTTGSIDLPDLTIDPRNGGEYTSEIAAIQQVLDVVQLVQDQVPAPIQSVPNELFNNVVGSLQSDN